MERVALRLELKKLREQANLSRQKVVELSGISMATYERIESGSVPSLGIALTLARFLKTPVEEIWFLAEGQTETGGKDE